MGTIIEKYGSRNWAVYLLGPDGPELVCVTVYKKGAVAVQAVTNALIRAKGAA
jgi:hypothetical protein